MKRRRASLADLTGASFNNSDLVEGGFSYGYTGKQATWIQNKMCTSRFHLDMPFRYNFYLSISVFVRSCVHPFNSPFIRPSIRPTICPMVAWTAFMSFSSLNVCEEFLISISFAFSYKVDELIDCDTSSDL